MEINILISLFSKKDLQHLLTESTHLLLKFDLTHNRKKESILTNQLVRSGTGIGANIREAFYAHGRADFVAKFQTYKK